MAEITENVETENEEEIDQTELEELEIEELETEDDIEGESGKEEECEEKVTPKYCKGSFRMMRSIDFTQQENYSDDYLKSKGLFKEGEAVEGD